MSDKYRSYYPIILLKDKLSSLDQYRRHMDTIDRSFKIERLRIDCVIMIVEYELL